MAQTDGSKRSKNEIKVDIGPYIKPNLSFIDPLFLKQKC